MVGTGTKCVRKDVGQIPNEILLGDEEMLNDDLIVSRTGAECPPDDEDECEYGIQSNNKDALIFPRSATTTKKTRRPPTSTTSTINQSAVKTQSPLHQEASSTSCVGGRKGSSTGTGSEHEHDDEEDCSEESSGTPPDATIEEPGLAIDLSTVDATDPASSEDGQPALATPLPPHTATASVLHRADVEPDSDVHSQPKFTGRGGDKTSDNGGHFDDPIWISGSGDPTSSVNKDQYLQHQHQTPGVSGFWSKFLTTVNINIYLMIAIAAAFVLLLTILIIAVCKYTGNGSRHHHSHRRSGKGQSSGGGVGVGGGGNTAVCGGASVLSPGPGNKSGYAYEACSTSPPQHHHQLGVTSGHSVVVNATPVNVAHGVHGASVCTPGGSMMMMSQSQYPLVQTPMNDASKPIVKKDVKEWYV